MPRKDRTALMALVAAAALMAGETESATTEIYKSVDKNGRVTYANAPMPGAVKTAVIENPPAPSEEDVRAAQEAYRHLEALASEMEKRRLQLEEQRARLNMEERFYEAYLQQSRALSYDNELPWVLAVDSGFHGRHFHKAPRFHDGKRHGSSGGIFVGVGQRPSPASMSGTGRVGRGR